MSAVVSRASFRVLSRELRRTHLLRGNAVLVVGRWGRFSTHAKEAAPVQESYRRIVSEQPLENDPAGFIMTEGSIRPDPSGSRHTPLQQRDNKTDNWTLHEDMVDHPSAMPTPKPEVSLRNLQQETPLYGTIPRTSLLMQLTDRVGVLHDVLRWFWKFDVNICRIESRPGNLGNTSGQSRTFDFFVDFEGSPSDPHVSKLLAALRPMTDKLLILDEKRVKWFPRHISELDLIADRVLDAGVDLIAEDHPGFHDPVYRERRSLLTQVALNHKWNRPIATIDYTPEEINVWSVVWDRMDELWRRYACREYLQALELMKKHCGYRRDNIPQQRDISDFLFRRTGFRMRPVAGLLSSRDFLNGLAFRVFFSTQYIRHSSRPLYTPEPDICHELLGHAPMLADPAFADFSQEIGLASLGASDYDIDRLAHCYWHSVEFGLCKEFDEKGQVQHKAYGAGLLSSFGELEYACGDHSAKSPDDLTPPEIKPWDPTVASRQEFPITTYQPIYFLAESLEDAKHEMRQFCENLPRPFFALHNAQTDTVHIDRPVVRSDGVPSKAFASND